MTGINKENLEEKSKRIQVKEKEVLAEHMVYAFGKLAPNDSDKWGVFQG